MTGILGQWHMGYKKSGMWYLTNLIGLNKTLIKKGNLINNVNFDLPCSVYKCQKYKALQLQFTVQ